MTAQLASVRLVDILIQRGYATEPILASLGMDDERQLAEHLLKNRIITSAHLAKALAERLNYRYVELTNHVVPDELFRLISASTCYQQGILPYRLGDGVLEVVVTDPYDLSLAERLEAQLGMHVRLLLSGREELITALKRSEGEATMLRDLSEDFRVDMITEGEDGSPHAIALETFGDETSGPVVKLINTLLTTALSKRASDVHMETHEQAISVKYRIDGVLYPATEMLDKRHHSALVSRLKVMAELDIAERRVPQDGSFRLRIAGREVDFRLSILPSVYGEDVVIRVLDKTSVTEGLRHLDLDGLNMEAGVLKRFRRAIREPYGMVLITGPTGSGKTTTLYAALSEINDGEEKIITIEDPVEYQLGGIVQIPVNEKKGLTFARGLRSILRHDPDKIMVGEIRDAETATIAVQSALTGHLVFTTVHANNVFDVVGRFAHMGIDAYSFVSALNCVMAQRLVRLICPKCKHEVPANPELIELSGLDVNQHRNQKWYEGQGCPHCHGTGYRGRSAITEFLDLTPDIRQMIIERRPQSELQQVAQAAGMATLRQSALARVFSGETTLKEINRVTFVD
ncbi:MAG TPA: GspE/PulE family protein [Gallionellaceae bacterium]